MRHVSFLLQIKETWAVIIEKLTLKSSKMMQPMLQTSQGWDQPNSRITSGAR